MEQVSDLRMSNNGVVRVFRVFRVSIYSEQETFENGCLPETSRCLEDKKMDESGENLGEIMEDFANTYGLNTKTENWQFIKDGEAMGRLAYSHLEEDRGNPLSNQEKEQWKKGKIKAYRTDYYCHVICYLMKKDEITDTEILENVSDIQ